MKILILGVCGTFMAGVALLAKASGFEVVGCDENTYPPMSTQLEEAGITVINGYDPEILQQDFDAIVVGNVIKRGNPLMEAILNQGLAYDSGPSWLSRHILQDRYVLAVAGTHGKTTTSSMLAWILQFCGLNPGFLIGGIPINFHESARLGDYPFFVVEADEYDSTFFDKRSKLVHYHPNIAIINNLEFDHADIFANLAEIQKQFHHFVRTIPNQGLIIHRLNDQAVETVIKQGCWTPVQTISLKEQANWHATLDQTDGSEFTVFHNQTAYGKIQWPLCGHHNIENALSAIAAAHYAGVRIEDAIAALSQFKGVKRRLEKKAIINNITVYDDFAHHPTAVQSTLHGLKERIADQRLIAVLEFGSYTMREGVHGKAFEQALSIADQIFLLHRDRESIDKLTVLFSQNAAKHHFIKSDQQLFDELVQYSEPGDHIVCMSNTGFSKKIEDIVAQLKLKYH